MGCALDAHRIALRHLGGISSAPVAPYSEVVQALAANAAGKAPAATAYAHLPGFDLSGGAGFPVPNALQKAWGPMPANTGAIDGDVGFGIAVDDNYTTTGNMSKTGIYFMSVAEHELTHALGRLSGLGTFYPSTRGLYRCFSGPACRRTIRPRRSRRPISRSAAVPPIPRRREQRRQFGLRAQRRQRCLRCHRALWHGQRGVRRRSRRNAAIGYDVACFATGTRLHTPRGEIGVEALRAGRDSVLTESDAVAPIVWIGARTTVPARRPQPGRVMPLCAGVRHLAFQTAIAGRYWADVVAG